MRSEPAEPAAHRSIPKSLGTALLFGGGWLLIHTAIVPDDEILLSLLPIIFLIGYIASRSAGHPGLTGRDILLADMRIILRSAANIFCAVLICVMLSSAAWAQAESDPQAADAGQGWDEMQNGGVQAPASYRQAQQTQQSTACHLCVVVDSLSTKIDDFGGQASGQVASGVLFAWKGAVTILILMYFLARLIGGFERQATLKELLTGSLIIVAISAILTRSTGGSSGLFMSDVYVPTRDFSVNFSKAMLTMVGVPSASGATTPFGQLFGQAENALMAMVYLGWGMATSGAPGVVAAALNILTGLFFAYPFLLTFCRFGAHLLEALVEYLFINSIAPILVVLVIFKQTRFIPEAAVKTYLYLVLSLIFSSIAIGLTVCLSNQYFSQLLQDVSQNGGIIISRPSLWIAYLVGWGGYHAQGMASARASALSGGGSGGGGFAGALTGAAAGLSSLGAAKKLVGLGTKGAVAGAKLVGKGLGKTAGDWLSASKNR